MRWIAAAPLALALAACDSATKPNPESINVIARYNLAAINDAPMPTSLPGDTDIVIFGSLNIDTSSFYPPDPTRRRSFRYEYGLHSVTSKSSVVAFDIGYLDPSESANIYTLTSTLQPDAGCYLSRLFPHCRPDGPASLQAVNNERVVLTTTAYILSFLRDSLRH